MDHSSLWLLEEKVKNKKYYKEYYRKKEHFDKLIWERELSREEFYLKFLDTLNVRFNALKRKGAYEEFYLDDNLELKTMKKEPHSKRITIFGKEQDIIFPRKRYRFEALSTAEKKEVIRLIKKAFQDTYFEKKDIDLR